MLNLLFLKKAPVHSLNSDLFFKFLEIISCFRPFMRKTHISLKKSIFSQKFLNTILEKSQEILKKKPSQFFVQIFSVFLQKNWLFLDFKKENLDLFMEIFISFPADSLYRNYELKQKTLVFLNKCFEERNEETLIFNKASNFSFFLKLSQNSDPIIRLLALNFLFKICDLHSISKFTSILDNLLNSLNPESMETNEIKTFSVYFLGKIVDFFIFKEENYSETHDVVMDIRFITQILSESRVLSLLDNIIRSEIHLKSEFIAATFFFLKKILDFDFQNSRNILINLETLEFINENINDLSENPIALACFADLLTNLFRKDPEVADYFMKSTDLISKIWGIFILSTPKAVSIEKIADLLNICLCLNEDLTIFCLNQSQVKRNIFIFFLENNQLLQKKDEFLELFNTLVYKFAKSKDLLEESLVSNPNETLAEQLLSEFYRMYKAENEKIKFLHGISGILGLSLKSKILFSANGFLNEILKEIKKEADHHLLVTYSAKNLKNSKKLDSLSENTKVLRFFLFDSIENKDKYSGILQENPSLIDVLSRIMKISLLNEDFIEDFKMVFVNLMNNVLLNRSFIPKINPIITDLAAQINSNKQDALPKKSIRSIFTMLEVAIENSEVRGLFIKSKIIEGLTKKVSECNN